MWIVNRQLTQNDGENSHDLVIEDHPLEYFGSVFNGRLTKNPTYSKFFLIFNKTFLCSLL